MLQKLTSDDFENKGIPPLPDRPQMSAEELKAKFAQDARESITPKFNANMGALESAGGAVEVGAVAPTGVAPSPAPAEGYAASTQSVLNGLRNYVDQKVVDVGAGDMAKAEYAPEASAVVNGDALQITSVYAHTKADYDVEFNSTFDFPAEAAVSIDGTAVILLDSDGNPIDGAAWNAGDFVCIRRMGTSARVLSPLANKANRKDTKYNPQAFIVPQLIPQLMPVGGYVRIGPNQVYVNLRMEGFNGISGNINTASMLSAVGAFPKPNGGNSAVVLSTLAYNGSGTITGPISALIRADGALFGTGLQNGGALNYLWVTGMYYATEG